MERNQFSIKKKTIGKNEKIMYQLLLMFCMLKRKKYVLLMIQNITYIVKNKLFLYSFNDSKWRRMTMSLSCNKKYQHYSKE